ncbi:MAG: pyridoxal-phosphate dependent enzyme [Nevskia sp.]|nr:pyridoxal-phosphate dependent enzyme [Nevskia sp.]
MAIRSPEQPSFHDQLESLLTEQLKTQPRNHAARLKLLELYYETHRAASFLRVAQELSDLTPDKVASPEWQKCLSMGRMLVPESPLFNTAGSDRIEFIGATAGTVSQQPLAQVRRLGDDTRFTRHFQTLKEGFESVHADAAFQAKLDMELTYLARRPSSLLHARRLSESLRGAQIYLKREDVSPRDTHLIISVVGQALLAQRLGRKTLVTSTIDGRRGVLTASIAARLGLDAVVFMDRERNTRHTTNVFRMWLHGANVLQTTEEGGQMRDPREAALTYWARNPEQALMVFGLEGAPEPYPTMAREFTAVIGRECQRQMRLAAKRSPDLLVARGGNNADALGMFPPFVGEAQTRLVCVEPMSEPEKSGVVSSRDPTTNTLSRDKQKVAQGILEGLEYPSVVREHRWLRETGRVEYVQASREAAKKAIRDLSNLEGITPAIETAHALGWACQAAAQMSPEQAVIVMHAEEVEKDLWDIGRLMGAPL